MTGRLSVAQLDALVDEITIDAYDDEEQLTGFLVGAQEALLRGESAHLVGVEVEVLAVDAGPDVRSALTARVRREGTRYEVAYADVTFAAGSQSGLVASAYRRWQGRAPYAGSA